MKNLDHGTDYIWSKDKFLARFDFMKEMYRQHQMGINGEEDDNDDLHIMDVSFWIFV